MSSRDASSSTMVRAPAPPPAAAAKVSVTLQVLYGAGASACGGTAALLEVGDTRLLLDCGWDARFDEREVLAALAPLAAPGRLDCVLVSQPDLAHCGALPLLYGRLGCTAPVFMSVGAWRLGQLALYDAVLARKAAPAPAVAASGFAALIPERDEATGGAGGGAGTTALAAGAAAAPAYSENDVLAAFQRQAFGGPLVELRFLEGEDALRARLAGLFARAASA
jgi:Cft2 family RNA processing exonuclease